MFTSSAPAQPPHALHNSNANGLHLVTNGNAPGSMIPTPTVQLKQEVDETGAPVTKDEAKDESQPEVDIVINNVVCSFSVRCHLNLKEIALNGSNVEYRRENGMVTMKLRYDQEHLIKGQSWSQEFTL